MLNCQLLTERLPHLFVENQLKKLKTFDSSYFIGKSHFEEEKLFSISVNVLIF